MDPYQEMKKGAGEVANQLTALDTLPEDLGLVSSTHMAAHRHLYLQFQASDTIL